MKKLLIISFSDIRTDARVLKQVAEFSGDFEVTTCSYGDRPEGTAHHVRIPSELVYWAYPRIDVMAHLYRRAYWANPVVDFARHALSGRRFDAILANDLDPVPLALSLSPTAGVHADLHEFAPREREDLLRWRLFVAPFRRWLCRTFLPMCASVTTVGRGIALEYSRQFGVEVGVVMNSTPSQDLPVHAVREPIRLVHSGACLRARHLEIMLQAVAEARTAVTLDLYLTPNDPGYLDELKQRSARNARITIHDPVPYAQLVETLNQFDVGVFVLPPTTFSYRWALPNKLFDYVQARLGVVVGPSPEMAQIVRQYQLGAVTASFDVDDLIRVLNRLTIDHVELWKKNADRAADALSADSQVAIWREAVEGLFEGTP